MKDNTIEVILVEPLKEARVVELGDDLESMQRAVGGMIEEYMPFEEEVAIICNEEGKLNNLDLNRAICDSEGNLEDIICGNFFMCYAPLDSESFLSMPEGLKEKYLEKFREPEMFFMKNGSIRAEKIRPKVKPEIDLER